MNARRNALTLVTLTICASASVAHAQPRHPHGAAPVPATAQPAASTQASPEIEAAHTHGIELRRQHRDAEARDLFRDLYARTHEPRVLAWQAGAEGGMGEWVAAEEHLSSALENASDPWITQTRTDLESDLAGFREHVGLLEILSTTPHAEIWLAGARVATLPLGRPLRVRAGNIMVEVRAAGFLTEVRPVSVAPGMRIPARETVNLTPEVPHAIVAVPAVVAAVQRPVQPPDERPATGLSPTRIAGIALLAAGAVGLGVGLYGGVHYNSLVSEYNANATCYTRDPMPSTACKSLQDSGNGALTLGIVGIAGGAALIAGGLTLVLLPVRRSARATTSALAVTPGPGDIGLSLRGSF